MSADFFYSQGLFGAAAFSSVCMYEFVFFCFLGRVFKD